MTPCSSAMPIIRTGPPHFDVVVPVVVVGAGACGCSAALAAKAAGAEVMMLERDSIARGNTALSGGQIPAAGTRLQRAAGIRDTAEILANDLIAKAQGQCDQDLARHLAVQSAITVDWLVDAFRMPLSCVTSFVYPGHSAPHMHASPSRFGAELLAVFVAAVGSQHIDLVTSAAVTDLYATESGRILGARVSRPSGNVESVGCDALILASNGSGGNRALIRKYIPEMAAAHYHGHAGNQGARLRGTKNWVRRSRT